MHLSNTFQEWLVTPVTPRNHLWFFNYKNECYKKFLKRRWKKKHICLVSIFTSWVWIRNFFIFCANSSSKYLGHLMQLGLVQMRDLISGSGMVYRILGYNFTNTVDWIFKKMLTQQKLRKKLQLLSWYLLNGSL